MEKLNKYNKHLYYALKIFIGLDIIFRTKSNLLNLVLFTGLFGLILLNDHLRWKIFYKKIKLFYTSVFISMAIGLLLPIIVEGYVDIYFYVLLYELILFTEGKLSNFFVGLEISFFVLLLFFRLVDNDYYNLVTIFKENLLDLIMIFMGMFFYCLALFTFRALRKEKRRVEKLNKELETSYNLLKDQAEKIEELTITKERHRVAGEIHDNLGHDLMALNMNLDVVEKTIDKDLVRARKLIQKSQELVKESIENLRKAVYALKEERPKDFVKSIEEMAKNIESTGTVMVVLKIDDESEYLPPEYKGVLYYTIKEALTNSIKHGKADEIRIDIRIGEGVKLIVEDNGIGCNDLVKGNGLLGIESRVKDYKGKVSFSSDNGFRIEILLPN
ncbi:MAG: sensor histidine kinase [Tissierellia bacterium]|nr:sensor histidine kinase [Tissierellia bacterium]